MIKDKGGINGLATCASRTGLNGKRPICPGLRKERPPIVLLPKRSGQLIPPASAISSTGIRMSHEK